MEPGPHKKTSKKSILILAALIAVVAGAVHNELLGPRIRAVPIRADDPMTVRFAIFNPAFTVTLKDVDMTCVPLTIQGHGKDGRAWTAKGQPFPLDVDIDLGPRMAFEYTCPINDNVSGKVDKMEVQVAVRYTRFGRRNQKLSQSLAWDSASRVWTLSAQN